MRRQFSIASFPHRVAAAYIRSSLADASEFEMMTSRPLTTELSVATEDFDLWDVSNATIVTFALKEFKVRIRACHFPSLRAVALADTPRELYLICCEIRRS